VTILLLITTFDIGGAERVYMQLARGLRTRGYRVIATALQGRSGTVATELQASGIETIDLGMRNKRDPFALVRLVRLLRRERVDVVYTFLIHSHVLGRLAARIAGVPIVMSSQQIMSWESRGVEWVNRVTARWCTAVVGVSKSVTEYLNHTVGIPRNKLFTIYNCVDVTRFDGRVLRRMDPDAPVVGAIARLNPEKDYDTLLDAFAGVRAAIPGARLVIAGSGPEGPRLQETAARIGIAAAVTFLGHVSDVRPVHEQIDVYVQPSHVEGLSVAILEALASCLPVVASRVGGNAEAVLDGEGGLLVPPRDAAALKDAILRLIRDRAEAERMGRRGREHVVRHFASETMVESTVDLIARLRSADAR
jgi:glycosyltransferase involved in cell wall biosynthesis